MGQRTELASTLHSVYSGASPGMVRHSAASDGCGPGEQVRAGRETDSERTEGRLLTLLVVHQVGVSDVEDEAGVAGLLSAPPLQHDAAALPLATPALGADGVLGDGDVGPDTLLEPDPPPQHRQLTAWTGGLELWLALWRLTQKIFPQDRDVYIQQRISAKF